MCAVSNKLFQSVKGVVIPLSSISNIVKGKQINGDFLAEVGEYYDYSGINVPLVAVCNVPPVARCNVPPQKWLQ